MRKVSRCWLCVLSSRTPSGLGQGPCRSPRTPPPTALADPRVQGLQDIAWPARQLPQGIPTAPHAQLLFAE